MTHTITGKDDFEHFRVATQVDFLGDSPVNHALTAAQELSCLNKPIRFKLTASIALEQLRFARSSQNKGKSLVLNC